MSGDRHLRSDPDGRLGGSPAKLATVLVKASPDYARSVAGQHLLQLLINLLARQFGVVREILLEVPDCDLHDQVVLSPRIGAGSLLSSLITLGRVVGADITATRLADGRSATAVVYVGGGLIPEVNQCPAIAVYGHRWRAIASTVGALDCSSAKSDNPLGPYLAACTAAGFVFKSAYEKQRAVDVRLDLWRQRNEEGPELEGTFLPGAYVLGLGAVGAAFGYVIAAARGLTGQLIGIDPQTMSDTDCNRILSGSAHDVGALKVDLFSKLFRPGAIEPFTFKGRWPEDYLGEPHRKVPAEIRREEDELRFEWVISCVDRDRDRVGIANALPRHVLSGSTLGMAAQTAYYGFEGECECLGCTHRTPQQLGVEERAEELRSVGREGRKQWYESHGASLREQASIEEYLDNPHCAGLGEADLARLGIQGEVDWAVGFVSTAAGVILAARFIRAALLGAPKEIEEGSEWRYLFWSDELLVSRAKRLPACPVCDELNEEWRSLWFIAPPGARRT